MTANIGQIHGMMLEEALLYLLEVSGYQLVESAVANSKADPTLRDGHAGLEVLGRGGVHPIDAVADLVISQPFSEPQRLLMEAKFRPQKTGIEVVRNAVGVLKDVSEYWVSKDKIPPKARYHYQYAIFSVSDYTVPAQKYAYAHDIYLIPLNRSAFLKPLIKAIQNLAINSFNTPLTDKSFAQLRRSIREGIRDAKARTFDETVLHKYVPLMQDFCQECRWLDGILLGMIARKFPLLLVPHTDVAIKELKNRYKVEIHLDKEGFYLQDCNSKKNLFSFDLPEALFNLYAAQDCLTEIQKLNDKSDSSEIQALVKYNGQARVVIFELAKDWLDKLSKNLVLQADENADK